MATALQHNTSLLEISLGGNDISDTGASALATALQCKTSLLQKLILYQNKFSVVGVRELMAALEHNTALQELNLLEDTIGDVELDVFRLAASIRYPHIKIDI